MSLQGVVGTNITIKVLCGVMADASLGGPYERYAAVAHLMMDTFSMKCLDAGYDNYLRDMTNTSWDGPGAGGGRWAAYNLTFFIKKMLWKRPVLSRSTFCAPALSYYYSSSICFLCWWWLNMLV